MNVVPTRTGKPGKMRKLFPVKESQGIWNRLEKSGNFAQNSGKMRGIYPKYWKSEEILASFYCFSLTFLVELPLLNRFFYLLNSFYKSTDKILENGKKLLE